MPSITINLPWPPSVNRLWKRGKGKRLYRSEEYLAWIAEAGGCWMQQRSKQKIKHIDGHYFLDITLIPPDRRLRDLGNYEKVLSDFCQNSGIIKNDHLCEKLSIEWDRFEGTAPGAFLILTSVLE